jgi:hypothetical protein
MKRNLMWGRASALPPGFRPAPSESGYALLFILMMAAVIAISLYAQLPRVAFEAQREKEQLLIDRGEQYKRGIQLYVRKFNRFPPDIRALENTQNIRFLRKQYVDPMTGKNEWRLIHVGPNGALVDSKVQSNPGKDKANAPDNFIAEIPMTAGQNPNQAVNQAARRRPGEDGAPPADPNNPGTNPGGIPGNPGAINGPVMVLPDGRIVPANSTGTTPPAPGANPVGGAPPVPGQPGQPMLPGQIPGQLAGQIPGQIAGQPPGGFQNTPNAPSGGAANLINQILTTPRPGGFNGVGSTSPDPITGNPAAGGNTISGLVGGTSGNNTGVSAGTGLGGTTVGGGIAGVASKYEQEGIKVYNQQTSYDLWEFIYDMSKDKSRGGGAVVPQTQPGQSTPQPNIPSAPLSGKS